MTPSQHGFEYNGRFAYFLLAMCIGSSIATRGNTPRNNGHANGGSGTLQVGVEVGEVGEINGRAVLDGFQGARGVEVAGGLAVGVGWQGHEGIGLRESRTLLVIGDGGAETPGLDELIGGEPVNELEGSVSEWC